MNPADHDPARIIEADKEFTKKLDFKDIIFPGKNKDIRKIKKKKRILSVLVFLVMKIRKNVQFMYQKNDMKKRLLIYY